MHPNPEETEVQLRQLDYNRQQANPRWRQDPDLGGGVYFVGAMLLIIIILGVGVGLYHFLG